MNKKAAGLQGLFWAECLAFASYIWQKIILVFMPDRFRMNFISISLFILFCLLAAGFMRRVLTGYAARLSSRTGRETGVIFAEVVITLTPLLLLYLEFLKYLVFLRDIRKVLPLLVGAGVIYLQVTLAARLHREHPESFPGFSTARALFARQSVGTLSAWMVAVSLLVYGLLASGWVFPAHPLTGDEPHYLILTQSLLEDGDIDLSNNYEDKTYLTFYPGEMDSHGSRSQKHPGRFYSRHLPGLSVLLAPAYAAGKIIAGLREGKPVSRASRRTFIFFVRLPVCLLTALLGGLFFRVAHEVLKSRKWAAAGWAFFALTAPVVYFSSLIYPEIPAALIGLWVYWRAVLKAKDRPVPAFLAGLGISLLPWFGVKFIIVAILLFMPVMWNLLKPHRVSIGKILLFLFPLVISGGLFLVFLWAVYGNLSPVSVYRDVLPANSMGISIFMHSTATKYLSHGLGILLDQRVGLFPYAPLFILAVPGLFLFRRKRRFEAIFFALLLVLYWAQYAFMMAREGYCPPGRHLLAVLWAAALMMAYAAATAERRGRLARVLIRTGMTLQVFLLMLTLPNPRLLYHIPSRTAASPEELSSHLLSSLSNSLLDFRKIVPSFADSSYINWIPLVLYLGIIFGITAIFVKRRSGGEKNTAPFALALHAVLVLVISLVVLGYVFFNVRMDKPVKYDGRDFTLHFQDGNNYGQELDGLWTRGTLKTTVLLESSKPLSSIYLSLSSEVGGEASVRVGGAMKTVEHHPPDRSGVSVAFQKPVGFPWKGGYLYSVDIRESAAFVPSRLDPGRMDGRTLGVFVRFYARVEGE